VRKKYIKNFINYQIDVIEQKKHVLI